MSRPKERILNYELKTTNYELSNATIGQFELFSILQLSTITHYLTVFPAMLFYDCLSTVYFFPFKLITYRAFFME
jgi:hypothetical protein